MSDTKQTAAYAAFDRLCPNGYFTSILSNPRTRDRALFEAAWTARGVADIAAVHSHLTADCTCSACDQLRYVEQAIGALDEDVK